MNDQPDQQLLRDYAQRGSDSAFTELVHRHINLVYSAALRMVRDAQLAEDVTQNVFIALAKNAGQLGGRAVLSGWLHNTARNLAANIVRSDSRRRTREQEAALMNELLSTDSDVPWEHVAGQLDLALSELSESDRDAVLLRYFEGKSAQGMALTLGISEEAAQKRVNRAVERLRDSFSKKGVSIGAAGLAAVISTNAVQSAPFGLAASIAASSVFAGAAMHAPAVGAAGKILVMTALKKALVAASAVAIAGAGIYEAHHLRSETLAKPLIVSASKQVAPGTPVAATFSQVQPTPQPLLQPPQEPALAASKVNITNIETATPSRPVVAVVAQVKAPAPKLRKTAHEPILAAAEEDLTNSLALLGPAANTTPDVWVQKAEIQARTGNWKAAVTNLEQALQVDPADSWAGYLLSSALLENGNLADYQTHSHAMMVRFGYTQDMIVAGRTGEAYLVAPYGENTDLQLSVQMIERKRFYWWREFYEGLAQFRLGHYRQAADSLEKDLSKIGSVNHIDRPPCEADCYLVLAMARQQLNEPTEAGAALAHGREVAEKEMPQTGSPDLGPYWWNGVTTRALLKEARETVERSNANPANASLTFSLAENAGAAAGPSKEIIPVAGPFSEPPSGTLRILPESVTASGGQMRFTVAGIAPGATIVIQASHQLFTPDSWMPISTNVATGTTLSVAGINSTNSQNQFFRVIETRQ